MADLLFSNKAVEDLTDIWNYTVETWSETQADKYYMLLVDTCRQIADSPHPLGKKYAEIMDGLFGYRAGKHIVFYRSASERAVEVVPILHERMDLKNRIVE